MYDRYKELLGPLDPIHPDTVFGKDVRLGHGVVIEKGCSVGDGTIIAHHCILRPNTIIGKNCLVGHLVVFEGDSIIGDNVHVGPQSHVTRFSIIEDQVFFGAGVCTSNTNHIVHGRDIELALKGPVIKRAARVAVGSHLFPGVTIGENALVGLGSVVTKDVPAREVWYGNPATFRGYVVKDELL